MGFMFLNGQERKKNIIKRILHNIRILTKDTSFTHLSKLIELFNRVNVNINSRL